MVKLLITIPIKSGPEYLERAEACKQTWLRDCPCDFRFFSDKDLGVCANWSDVRPLRTQRMCTYTWDNGYDFIFRVDSDAYVWVERLLTSGFENHDYTGHCIDYPERLAQHRTANGGCGFTLSRRAMEIIIKARPVPESSGGVFWGDIWAGKTLFHAGIKIHRSERFKDGAGIEDIRPRNLPPDHDYISVHPVTPEGMREFYEQP